MGIRSDRSRQRDPVGAGLFLSDSPGLSAAGLQREVVTNELWPLNPGFGFHNASLAIQMEDPIQFPHVDE
jgi:hypothetical protein